jgi:hypothetical protein
LAGAFHAVLAGTFHAVLAGARRREELSGIGVKESQPLPAHLTT